MGLMDVRWSEIGPLLPAKQNPDEHGDLVVRVAGYSARFTSLSAETQDEIITRYKYSG
jgi:pyruvate-formate lyase